MDRNEEGDFLVKNLHFCTEGLLTQIYEGQPGNTIETYRTGFIPNLYPGDVINLNKRIQKKDIFICKGKIKYVFPLQYKEFAEYNKQYGYRHKKGLDEIKQYKRKFHPDHWFFNIGIELYPEVMNK